MNEHLCMNCLRVFTGTHDHCPECGGDLETGPTAHGTIVQLREGVRYWYDLCILRPIVDWNETDGATWATERQAIEQWAAWLAEKAYRSGWAASQNKIMHAMGKLDEQPVGGWYQPKESAALWLKLSPFPKVSE